MMRSIVGCLLVLIACVTVENNTGGMGGGVFGSGANDGTGNPTTCRGACQNAINRCGNLEGHTVDSCQAECVQAAPAPALITCVSAATTCDSVFACGGGGSGSGSGSGSGGNPPTCGGACSHLLQLCGTVTDENGQPVTVGQCEAACIGAGAPQPAIQCLLGATTCDGAKACGG